MKQLLTQTPVRQFSDFSKDLAIHVDASRAGAGAILAQRKGDDLVIIACFSQRFDDSQRHYCATLKECYAVVLAIQPWRPYLWGRHYACDRSRRPAIPIINARYIEHVDTLGNSIAVF